ncbi:MAG: radical SAM family heme chaperone HemW [Planctomycetota bacterium]
MQGIAATIEGQSGAGDGLDAAHHLRRHHHIHAGGCARSLYLHVPFCFHKCHYCDFYSFVDSQDRQERFAYALAAQMRTISETAGPLESVFVGGGTPTLLRRAWWDVVLGALHQYFAFEPACEFTVECNPETADLELLAALAAGGVNRLSVGAQSFDPRHLDTLERWHDPASVPRALDTAVAAGIERLSIDLIYAIPGQTLDDVEADLRAAIALPVEHISAYALTYEPNTAMTARLARNEFEPAGEELELAMFDLVAGTLGAHGLARYEVSNFARHGAECRHNLAYWRQEDWLAGGPSASGHVNGWRFKNVPNLREWLGVVEQIGAGPLVDVEPPDPCRALAERIMTGLRLREGLPIVETCDGAAAIGAHERLTNAVAGAIDLGRLEVRGDRWALTDAGLHHADGIAADLMAALDPD